MAREKDPDPREIYPVRLRLSIRNMLEDIAEAEDVKGRKLVERHIERWVKAAHKRHFPV